MRGVGSRIEVIGRLGTRGVAILLLATLASGCMLLRTREEQKRAEASCRFRGTVSLVEPGEGPRIALLIDWSQADEPRIIDHYTLEQDGPFRFSVVRPGTYSIAAFHDRNSNFVYEPEEPAQPTLPSTLFTVEPGELVSGIEIRIDPDGRTNSTTPIDIHSLRARPASDQFALTLRDLTVLGDVVDLEEERFGPESGPFGLWEPLSFIFEHWAGVYMLEPYDPARIPVLFVHGISGYPQEFRELIESLDRERFQPWFYFYPSGGKLPGIAEHLRQAVIELRGELGFEGLAVVAHSMGGLVAREFVLGYHESTGRETIPLFVTLSTPWAGHEAARMGVERSPVVVYSWIDVAPESEFLTGLFYAEDGERRRLPEHLDYHLLFGHDNGGSGPSSDRVVSVASELRPEAQDEARSQRGFDTDHAGILDGEATAKVLNSILAKLP